MPVTRQVFIINRHAALYCELKLKDKQKKWSLLSWPKHLFGLHNEKLVALYFTVLFLMYLL